MILAILQARVSSSRLPGKVLKPLLGVPMLLRQIERVKRARGIDRLIVATSAEESDNAVEDLCVEAGVDCFRGSLKDVLDRYYQAAKTSHPEHVIRLTGDCPLSDPELIDQVIEYYLAGNWDYVSNSIEPTFPDGLDVEMFSFSSLEFAWRESMLPSHREHVTLFIRDNPGRFRLGCFKNDRDLSELRWTVDEEEDFVLVNTIYERLYPSNPAFVTADVLALLSREPSLSAINAGYQRNAGLNKSFAEDAEFMRKQGA